MDANLYASNVRKLMAQVSGLTLCKRSASEYYDEIHNLRIANPDSNINLHGWRRFFMTKIERSILSGEFSKKEI